MNDEKWVMGLGEEGRGTFAVLEIHSSPLHSAFFLSFTLVGLAVSIHSPFLSPPSNLAVNPIGPTTQCPYCPYMCRILLTETGTMREETESLTGMWSLQSVLTQLA